MNYYTKEMQKKVYEINRYISSNFDTRAEGMLFNYIMEKGTSFIRCISDEDIEKLDGNGLMTKGFVQAMVRTAREICNNYSEIDLFVYIRMSLWITPTIAEAEAYRNDDGKYVIGYSREFDVDDCENIRIHIVVEEED